MSEIEISFNNSYLYLKEAMEPLLAEFKRRHHASVPFEIYDWGLAWSEFLKISLYGHGPVISQTGNSWMGSLIAQNSLRVFRDREVLELKGKDRFLPGSWESCLDFDDEHIVAIPWILDGYLVYYRRDVLAKAGIDEAGAFSTAENFNATLQKLQDTGMQYPFAVPTIKSNSCIHTIASWVWGQGGDFINQEGTSLTLSRPETRKGLKMYFDLYRFISPEAQDLTDFNCWEWFLNGKIAVTVRNAELLFRMKQKEFSDEFVANVGTAPVPGVPLLGGSNLVVWNHIRPEQEQDAINLIKYLTSTETQLALFENTGLIPANLQVLERIASDSSFAPVFQTVKKGRSFPRIRRWGLIEDKLNLAFANTWTTLLTAPTPNVDNAITSQLDPIETRINLTLSQ